MTVAPHIMKKDGIGNWTQEQRQFYAENFDMLIMQYWDAINNPEYIDELLSYNPELKIYIYYNVNSIDEKRPEYADFINNNWVLKSSDGTLCGSEDFPTLKKVDIGNTDYISWLCAYLKALVGDNPKIIGLFADGTNSTWYKAVFPNPIDPRTGSQYSQTKWANDTRYLVSSVKSYIRKPYIALGKGMTCGGCPWEGYYLDLFKSYADLVLPVVDGVCLEGFIRWGSQTTWRTPEQWALDLEFLKILNGMGKITLAWVKPYNGPASVDQISMFGFCTYLLAYRDSKNYFITRGYEREFLPISKIDLGVPVGEYFLRSDAPIYQRNFTKAKVLVNPTEIAHTIQVEGDIEPRMVESYTGLILNIPTPISLPFWVKAVLVAVPFGLVLLSRRKKGRRG